MSVPTEVTENWSERRLVAGYNADGSINWTAERGFIVTGSAITNQALALAACPQAIEGASHDIQPLMKSKAPEVTTPKGPDFYHIRAQYQVLKTSASPPVFRPTIWKSDQGSMSVPSDEDADGNAKLNSAWDPFDPPSQRDVGTFTVSCTIDQPYYDIVTAANYINTVCNDVFKTPFGTFEPLEVKCTGIIDLEPWEIGSDGITITKQIKVQYLFEVRLLTFWKDLPDGISPFDVKALDQGFNAYFTEDASDDDEGGIRRGHIAHKRDGLVTTPIRLNGNGAPFDTEVYKVTQDRKPATELADDDLPPGMFQRLIPDTAVFVFYKEYPRKAFADFGLPIGI